VLPGPTPALRPVLPRLLAGPGTAVALTGATMLLVAEVTRMAARGSNRIPEALLGGLALLVLLARPRRAVLALLLLTCTFFLTPILQISIGGIHSDAAQLLAAAVILRSGLPALQSRSHLRAPLVAVALLVLAVAAGSVWSLTHGGARANVIGDAEAYGFYLLVLPFAVVFGDENSKQWLEAWVMRIATVGGALTLLAVTFSYQLEGRPGTVLDVNDAAQTERLRPALLPLLFLATLLLLSRIVLDGWTVRRAAAAAIFVAVWGISFNRSSWVSLAFACGLFLLVRKGPRRPRRTLASALLASVVIPGVFLLASNDNLGGTASAIADRVSTIGQHKTFSSTDSSFQDRALEYSDARKALAHSPAFGVGVGNSYGARRAVYDAQLDSYLYYDRLFSHNSWLYLYLQLGLLGALAAIALTVHLVRQCLRAMSTLPLMSSGRAAAAGCAMVGAALEALANPNLFARGSAVALCVAVSLMTAPRPPAESTP
jgi:O-antigen ligase